MITPIYQIDAFTNRRFAGNPAAVMPMETFPPATVMQEIASENNLSETAFLVPESSDYRLRWFTPSTEVPLCGHATLASAAVVMERLELARRQVVFHTASGALTVTRSNPGYLMDFPASPAEQVSLPDSLVEAVGAVPEEVWVNESNYLAVFASEAMVRTLVPDMAAIAQLDRAGVIVSARGSDLYDFVSRYFAPAKGIPEDPVTGGAHCTLAPYWATRLGRTRLRAFQASRRGGELVCVVRDHRVELEGECVFYMEGKVEI